MSFPSSKLFRKEMKNNNNKIMPSRRVLLMTLTCGVVAWFLFFQILLLNKYNIASQPMLQGFIQRSTDSTSGDSKVKQQPSGARGASRVLKAYMELPFTEEEWNAKPFMPRALRNENYTLLFMQEREYPTVTSCSNLQAQWPVNDNDSPPTNIDPYLPWIHDVFPSHDGTKIIFVAQNKRRCNTGVLFTLEKEFFQPQAALFQHVPIARVKQAFNSTNKTTNTMRYKLTSHEQADEDGVETRFMCRFSSTGQETLSKYFFNYDYMTRRKGSSETFTEKGFDNDMIWSSQLVFYCPVPTNLQERIQTGDTVINDYATMYLDLIPIRTKPRYGYSSVSFLPPKYTNGSNKHINTFNATEEWGENHILPPIELSGRWENIPICRPPLIEKQIQMEKQKPQQQFKTTTTTTATTELVDSGMNSASKIEKKPHKLVACVWASTAHRNQEKSEISGGSDRLREWITFHLLVGFDHIYVYDNSAAFFAYHQLTKSSMPSLKATTDLFSPLHVTHIDWPAEICNNNVHDFEWSSQYAAEASCILRYGPHTDWMSTFDIDEYLIPMMTNNNHTLKDVLLNLDEKGDKILTFRSQRARPRFSMIEKPSDNYEYAVRPREGISFLQVYNCEREKNPKCTVEPLRADCMPAEKEIYRPDYVLMHFVHYSYVTTISQMSAAEASENGYAVTIVYREKHRRMADEVSEALMLHTKQITKVKSDWINDCKTLPCEIGFPWPNGDDSESINKTDELGFFRNCFVIDNIETNWVPKLHEALLKSF